jgi:hypothetical protein
MHVGADSHGHGMVGRMTFTDGVKTRSVDFFFYWEFFKRGLQKNERHTEGECAENEKQGRGGNEEWPRGSCEPVSAAFDAFETSKDEAGAGPRHDDA